MSQWAVLEQSKRFKNGNGHANCRININETLFQIDSAKFEWFLKNEYRERGFEYNERKMSPIQ